MRSISISGGVPTIFLPLAFILFITAIKDYYEDYKRKVSDSVENCKKVLSYKDCVFQKVQWQSLEVGDIIQVTQNEQIPADILLLFSED